MFHEWAMRDATVLRTVQRGLGEATSSRRDINVKADRARSGPPHRNGDGRRESGRFALQAMLASSN